MITKSLCCGLVLAGLMPVWARAQEKDGIQTEVLAKATASWIGDDLPAYGRGKPEVTILRITIPPHTSLPEHKHPVINAGVLLKGTLTVVVEGNRTLHLREGDSLVEVVNRWHHGTNEGDTPAELLVFYAGIEGSPITVPYPAE